ncbi:MAG: threonine/serine exporter family protein [Acidimicrobiales bacterium]|jgi:uncharacterized membrane protein YjjB (DUF3815 family)
MAEPFPGDRADDDLDRLVRRSGKFLLRNSSEGTFDLQVTLRGIGSAYGARIESQILMEGLSFVVTHPDGHQRSGMVHAQPTLERLDQVADFKDLTGRITGGALAPGEAVTALDGLESTPPPFPWWARFMGVVLFAAGFAPSMQANWRQVGASVILGAVMATVYLCGERFAVLRTILPLLASTAVGIVGFGLLHEAHAHGGPVLVMVPALFVMIPGDFLCAAAAEIAVGQFTVGTIRLVQSVFVLLQLAAGVIIAAGVTGAGTASLISSSTVDNIPWVVTAAAWIPFTIGMALTFCARRRDIGWLLLGVYVAWGVQLLVTWSFGDAAGTFVAATVLTLMGVLVARSPDRPPSLVVILGGVFVLTVGSMALRGLTTLAGGHLIESFHDLATFSRVAGSLSLGLIVGTSIGTLLLRRRSPAVAAEVASER